MVGPIITVDEIMEILWDQAHWNHRRRIQADLEGRVHLASYLDGRRQACEEMLDLIRERCGLANRKILTRKFKL